MEMIDLITDYDLIKAGIALDAMEKHNQSKEQTKLGSLLEAHFNALVGAPLAIISHGILLSTFGVWAIDNPYFFALLTWPVFFYLSVTRIWGIRRIFIKWGINLEPSYIYKKMRGRV